MKYEVINRESKNSPYLLKVSIYSEEFEIEGRKCKCQEYVERNLSCPSGKDVYLSYQDAENALRQRGADKKNKKRVYRCSICGHYHLTTNDGAGKLKRKYDRRKSERGLQQVMLNYSESELKYLKEKNARAFSLKAFRNKIALSATI